MSNIKVTRSFRLSPESVELVKRASEETGLSQGEIIEHCILEKIESILQKRRERRALLSDPSALREMGSKPTSNNCH
jgi:hypothetical protein